MVRAPDMMSALASSLAAGKATPTLEVWLEGQWPAWSALDAHEDITVREVPVADRAMVAAASGLALAGTPVVVVLSSSGRLAAVHEALAEAARWRHRGLDLALTVVVPYGSEAGPVVDGPMGGTLAGIDGLDLQALSTPRAAGDVCEAGVRVWLAARTQVVAPPRATDRPDVHVVTWAQGLTAAADAAQVAEVALSVHALDAPGSPPSQDLVQALRAPGRWVVAAPAGDDALAQQVLTRLVQQNFLYLEAPPAVVEATTDAIVRGARDAASY